jgi:hypothetical protein
MRSPDAGLWDPQTQHKLINTRRVATSNAYADTPFSHSISTLSAVTNMHAKFLRIYNRLSQE